VRTYAISVTLNYKYILYIGVTHTNYFISSLNIYAGKTPVPNSNILFTYPSISRKPYYNNSLSLNKSINLTSIGL